MLAKQEFENLAKAVKASAQVPAVYVVSGNAIAMEFIGSGDGIPAPSVAGASLVEWDLVQAYLDVLTNMRRLYQKAGLVHGSLGEDTILFYKSCDCPDHPKKVFFVSFANAVDRSEPELAAALERDIESVQSLFESMGLPRSDSRMYVNSLWDNETIRMFVTLKQWRDVYKLLRGYCSNRVRRNLLSHAFSRDWERQCFKKSS